MNKKSRYKWLVGVQDTITHENIYHLKNLSLEEFDLVVKELRLKFR
jgi:hypothetical protein